MSRPFSSDVHQDQALTNLSIEFKNSDFVAEQILPVLPVKKDSDIYYTFGRQDFKRYNTKVSPTGKAREFEYTITKSNPYALTERALKDFVPQAVIDNADDVLDPQKDATTKVMNAIMLDYEAEVASYMTNPSNYASGHSEALSGTNKWSDYANSNPLKKVDDVKVIVQKACGKRPNTMLVSANVFYSLRNHPVIKDVIKYTQFGIPTNADFAKAFEVDNFVVASSVYDTEAEGATRSTSYLWDNVAILLYAENKPGIKTMSFGYTFRKNGYRKVLTWNDQDPEGTWVKVADKFDMVITANMAGYLLTSVIA